MSDESKDAPKTAPEAVPADKMLYIRQAADFIGVSPQRINKLRQSGEIAGKRDGWRGWSFREADLMAYVERAAGVAGAATPESSVVPSAPPKPAWAVEMNKLVTDIGPGCDDDDKDKVAALADEAPIVRMANAILVNALESGASDIHIEPDRTNIRVRVRIDGVMLLIMTIPKHIQAPLMNRYKVMADVPVFQRHSAHLGNIPIKHGDNLYEIRVSVVPSLYGESIVMHVLNRNSILIGLSKLGFEMTALATLERLADSGSGLLLFAGPPGSGLSTTAYTLLNKINFVTRKIVCLEQIPEYKLGGIEQTYLKYSRMSRTEGTAALLRHDPDILFLGDISDAEAARCAVDAALSGVLVIATISALDSIDALRRLVSLGVSKPDVAQAVIGVVGQRLVRKICKDCREEYLVDADDLRRFGFRPSSPHDLVALYRGAGCENCRNRGYRGRIALFEVLQMNDEIAELLRLDAPRTDLKDAVRAAGIITLNEDGLNKLLQGLTTPDEVMRTLGTLARP